MRLILTLCAALALTGCGITPSTVASASATIADSVHVPPPATIANITTLDEKAAIASENAYTLAAKAAALAIKAGLVSDPATIRRIGELDNKAYLALATLRAAYRTGNAESYRQAFTEANAAVLAINDLL